MSRAIAPARHSSRHGSIIDRSASLKQIKTKPDRNAETLNNSTTVTYTYNRNHRYVRTVDFSHTATQTLIITNSIVEVQVHIAELLFTLKTRPRLSVLLEKVRGLAKIRESWPQNSMHWRPYEAPFTFLGVAILFDECLTFVLYKHPIAEQ